MYKIINNLTGNHYQCIIEIAKDADTLYIISPFLMDSFDTFFAEIKNTGIKNIHLITTLKNNDIDLLQKADALHSFCELCKDNNIHYKVYIDNKLHGKIYIGSKDESYTCGILTSANFTEKGLNYNHEWGIWINNSETLKILISEVFTLCSKPLSSESISGIINKVDEYLKKKPEPSQPKLDLSISEFIYFGLNFSDKRYFFKPIGDYESPYPESAKLNSNIEDLYFSRRKPRSVRKGDVLICYAVGTTKLLGYFEVTTEPAFFEKKPNDRWPWSVEGKNLCPLYSENWTQYNNTLSKIKDSFPTELPVTYNGGKTLGALNFGSDKVRITESFANHLIGIMEKDAKSKGI